MFREKGNHRGAGRHNAPEATRRLLNHQPEDSFRSSSSEGTRFARGRARDEQQDRVGGSDVAQTLYDRDKARQIEKSVCAKKNRRTFRRHQ
jgi:hypothetical protein